jgi:hypothetical protein
LLWGDIVSNNNNFSMQQPEAPSVYTLSDRQLAAEYARLTGAMVQVPSPRNAAAWWQWRKDLQEKLSKERSSRRPWYSRR